jgi:hypothetical protein
VAPKEPGQVLTITVEEVPYSLDLTEFSGTETGILKRVGHIGGVAQIGSALQAGDLELVVALAVIAARRVGVTLDHQKLLDAKMGAVTINVEEPEVDAGPPAPAAAAALEAVAAEPGAA